MNTQNFLCLLIVLILLFCRKEILSDMKEAKEGEKEGGEGETEEEKAEKKKQAETGAAPGEDGADFVQVNLCYFSAQNFKRIGICFSAECP
jgi:hypothetical protein